MNVKQIIKEYLEKNNFDGLCNGDCGCELEDLVACCEFFGDCCPGYKHLCKKCEQQCQYYSTTEGAFCIQDVKQK